jgi:hypothetical protein
VDEALKSPPWGDGGWTGKGGMRYLDRDASPPWGVGGWMGKGDMRYWELEM